MLTEYAEQLSSTELEMILSQGVMYVNHHQMAPEEAIEQLLGIPVWEGKFSDSDVTQLIAQLIRRVSDPPLDTEESHSEFTGEEFDPSWLDEIGQWTHTESLRKYRTENTSLSENAKANLEATSLRILSNSYNPSTEEFVWRGLVVGNVQSGKTATFSTLIARAFDVGYRLVIVPSGRLESLRKQTSSRLDAELAEALPDDVNVRHITKENDSIFRHYSGTFYNYIRDDLVGEKNLIVTKKISRVLSNLNYLLYTIAEEHPEFRDFPVLIIDDESDEAGVEISDNQDETTAVNFQLRRLISNPVDRQIRRLYTPPGPNQDQSMEIRECPGFRRVMFLGFTATPYGTMFQRKNTTNEQDEEEGKDLFPRDYLLVLDDPPNYCGGEVFIGRNEISDIYQHGDEYHLELPRSETGLNTLSEIPANDACNNCRLDSVQVGNQEIRTHMGRQRSTHFWNDFASPVDNTSFPILASNHCDCVCHQTDERHLLATPFRAARENWEPQMTDSLLRAIDDFIISGAAVLQRQGGHDERPVSMMALISTNTEQHSRVRDLIRDRIQLIDQQWPRSGKDRFKHLNRLRVRWENSFMADVSQVNEGFVVAGGGDSSEEPDRSFSHRPVPYTLDFDDVAEYVPAFLEQIEYVILNSGDLESGSSEVDFDDNGNTILNGETIPNLKAVWIGGYNLGRGLTLKSLVTTYMLRIPGDGSIATQIQRWCGYRIWPGENILDLMRVHIPWDVCDDYRDMLSVECINRNRLGVYDKQSTTPENVFQYLEESPGFSLVSRMKEGEMVRISNPLQGKEKTETTYFLNSNEDESISGNWSVFNDLLKLCSESEKISTERLKDGWLFRDVPAQAILELTDLWVSAPHSANGFSPKMIHAFISQSLKHGELGNWSVFYPHRKSPVPADKMGFIKNPNGSDFGNVDSAGIRPPTADREIDGETHEFSETNPFSRSFNARAQQPAGFTYRIGTVSDPEWRSIDLAGDQRTFPRPQGSDPLLVLTPLLSPFNLISPSSSSYLEELTTQERYREDGQWPTLPSLSFLFPESDIQILRSRTVGHSQYES